MKKRLSYETNIKSMVLVAWFLIKCLRRFTSLRI